MSVSVKFVNIVILMIVFDTFLTSICGILVQTDGNDNLNNGKFMPVQKEKSDYGQTKLQATDPMKNATKHLGDSHTFICDITGSPKPEYEWFKDGEKISTSAQMDLRSTDYGSVLRIKEVGLINKGRYTCIGRNSAGSRNYTAYLTVKPSANPKKNKADDKKTKSVNRVIQNDSGFCQNFKSEVCKKYLGEKIVFVKDKHSQGRNEEPLSKLFSRITESGSTCSKPLIEATCYYNFPQCAVPTSSKAVAFDDVMNSYSNKNVRKLCREDCEKVVNNICKDDALDPSDFEDEDEDASNMMMNCSTLPWKQLNRQNQLMCISLDFFNSDVNYLINGSQNAHLFTPDIPDIGAPSAPPTDIVSIFISVGIILALGLIMVVIWLVCRRSLNHQKLLHCSGVANPSSAGTYLGMKATPNNNMMQPTATHQPATMITTCNSGAKQPSNHQLNHVYHQPPSSILSFKDNKSTAGSSNFALKKNALQAASANNNPFTPSLVYCSASIGDQQQQESVNIMDAHCSTKYGNNGLMNSVHFSTPVKSSQTSSSTTSPSIHSALKLLPDIPMNKVRFGELIGKMMAPTKMLYDGHVLQLQDSTNNNIQSITSVTIKTFSFILQSQQLSHHNSITQLQLLFHQECQKLSQLRHPNLMTLLAQSTNSTMDGNNMTSTSSPWCQIFESCDQGQDLYQILRSSVQLTLSDRLHILCQVASGLDYMSSTPHFLVHGDVAARNVIVYIHQGCSAKAKLCDFGQLKEIYATDYEVPSNNHLRLVPVRWTAPECLKTHADYTNFSDAWSFGVLIWEMWSHGQQPFFGYTNSEVIDLVYSRQMLACPPECPSTVYNLSVECWNELPQHRPYFKDVLSQLRNIYINSEPVVHNNNASLGLSSAFAGGGILSSGGSSSVPLSSNSDNFKTSKNTKLSSCASSIMPQSSVKCPPSFSHQIMGFTACNRQSHSPALSSTTSSSPINDSSFGQNVESCSLIKDSSTDGRYIPDTRNHNIV